MYHHRLVLLITALVVAGTLAGCATIINGNHQEIAVSSRPTRATVFIDGYEVGTTPLVTPVRRKGKHILTIELPGYETEEIILDKEISPWIIGNIFFGGPIGIGIDAITGAIWTFEPDDLQIDLLRTGSRVSVEENTLHLAVVLQPQEGRRKVGQLTPVR